MTALSQPALAARRLAASHVWSAARTPGGWRSAPRPVHPSTRAPGPACHRSAMMSSTTSSSSSRSVPTSVFVPCSIVIGRSVLARMRQAGDAEGRRLFLDAAGVGQHHASGAHQRDHRRDTPAAGSTVIGCGSAGHVQPEPLEVRGRSRVHRPDDRQALGDLADQPKHVLQAGRDHPRSTGDAASPGQSRPSDAARSSGSFARGTASNSESIIRLPTKWMRPAPRPRAAGWLPRRAPSCTAGRRSGPSGPG